jgi:hypothetical protein
MKRGIPINGTTGFGLRQRLLLSFIAISGFAVIAAVVGSYAFYAIGEALQHVTKKSVPPAIATLEFAQNTERIVAAGPALLAANKRLEVNSASTAAEQEVKEAARLLDNLPATGIAAEKLIEIRAVFNQIAATERKATLLCAPASTLRATFCIGSQMRIWDADLHQKEQASFSR